MEHFEGDLPIIQVGFLFDAALSLKTTHFWFAGEVNYTQITIPRYFAETQLAVAPDKC